MQKIQKNQGLDIPVENLYLILQIPVNPVFKEKKNKIPFVSPNKILTSPFFSFSFTFCSALCFIAVTPASP